MSEIRFAGQLTEQELRTITALALRKMWLVTGTLMGLLAATALTLGGWDLFHRDPSMAFRTFLPFMIAGPVVFLAQRFGARHQWKNNKIMQRPVNGVVSDDGIMWNIEGLSSMRAPWDLLLGYRESRELLLIYQGPNQVMYFPRRYFSCDDDWLRFRTLVSAKLARR
jgi:hypothetical protein